ncbi:unnamed protein product [Penicillium egyptiacum]|uniref:Uncharacterized protein n=1 Tax=Penicillium egyptiacum TaxID=1303716 RepID=A0A9W4K826_9EURO|nr:unnamed protein product [Penicillium egyptiacum]
MSNIIHKVKDAVTGHHHDASKTSSSNIDDARDTYGSSHNTTENAPSKHTYGSGSGPGYETPSNTGAGDYGSKSDTYGSNAAGGYGSSNTGSSTNAGPHDSKLANKVDSRVDSYLDNRGKHAGTTGSSNAYDSNSGRSTGETGYGSRDVHGNTTGHSSGQTGYGSNNPLASNDNYGSNTGRSTSGYGSSDTHGSTAGHSSGQSGYGSSKPLSGSDNYGSSTGHSGYGSSNPVSGSDNYGSNTGRFTGQSDYGANYSYGAGAGSSYNNQTSKTGKTTGPHGSDLLNKLDPRVNEKDALGSQRNY